MLNVCVCACGWKATSRPVVYNERLKHVAIILIENVGYSFTTLKKHIKKSDIQWWKKYSDPEFK